MTFKARTSDTAFSNTSRTTHLHRVSTHPYNVARNVAEKFICRSNNCNCCAQQCFRKVTKLIARSCKNSRMHMRPDYTVLLILFSTRHSSKNFISYRIYQFKLYIHSYQTIVSCMITLVITLVTNKNNFIINEF